MTDAGPRVAPNLAPGGIYVQVQTDLGEVLAGDALTPETEHLMAQIGFRHQQVAFRWCDAHPGRDCWIYQYDGETGDPMVGLAINSDLEAGLNGPVPEGTELVDVGAVEPITDPDARVELGMVCPICHTESRLAVSIEQVFCTNPECVVMMWDGTDTLAEFMVDAAVNPPVDLGFPS